MTIPRKRRVSDGCAYLPAAVSDVPQLVQLLNLLFAIEQDFQADPEKQARGYGSLSQRLKMR